MIDIWVATWDVNGVEGDVYIRKEWDEDSCEKGYTIYILTENNGIPLKESYDYHLLKSPLTYIEEVLGELREKGDLKPTFEWNDSASPYGNLFKVLICTNKP